MTLAGDLLSFAMRCRRCDHIHWWVVSQERALAGGLCPECGGVADLESRPLRRSIERLTPPADERNPPQERPVFIGMAYGEEPEGGYPVDQGDIGMFVSGDIEGEVRINGVSAIGFKKGIQSRTPGLDWILGDAHHDPKPDSQGNLIWESGDISITRRFPGDSTPAKGADSGES